MLLVFVPFLTVKKSSVFKRRFYFKGLNCIPEQSGSSENIRFNFKGLNYIPEHSGSS